MATKQTRQMTNGQKAYEAKRAAKAGVSLDKWLDGKQREQERATKEKAKAKAVAQAAKVSKKPGLFARLLERAHKPLS